MGKELQLREGNFVSISEESIDLRPGMNFGEAKEVLGTIWRRGEDDQWVVKPLPSRAQGGSTHSPILEILSLLEMGKQQTTSDPTGPVLCF